MDDFKFVLNTAGVAELLKSAEMTALISELTDQQAAETGGEGHVYVGFDRVRGMVRSGSND